MKRLEDLAKEGDSPVYSLMVRLFKSNAAKLGSLRSEKGEPLFFSYILKGPKYSSMTDSVQVP